jgi:hypothetical protein
MATIKMCTDIPQSKKLAEILSIESADMYYMNGTKHVMVIPNYETDFFNLQEKDIPCWSLASLLGVLPDYTLQTNTDGTVFVVCESKKPMLSDAYDNPIDACYEMILKLNELKML